MIFTAAEIELLGRLIAHYEDRAQRCEGIDNRPMAERQKSIEIAKAELLKKLKGMAERLRQ